MKSRIQIEMISALSIVFLTMLPPQTLGQGYGGGEMGMGGMSDMDQILRPSLSYTVVDKPYRATRVRSFRYVVQSFRPKELSHVNSHGSMGGGMGMGEGGMDMGSSGGYGSSEGSAGMASGMPSSYGSGSGGGYPGSGGTGAGAAGGFSEYGISNSDQASDRLTIQIHAYLFESEKVYDRTRIELMIEQPSEMGMEEMAGGFSEGAGMGMGMPSGPSRMKPLASLGTPKTKASARLSQTEIKLVSDIICQTIWKADVVKALFATKGQGESASENEKFLKQLLAEQYDTQLARQQMEAESIKRRLDQLLDELKRRKVAKDRVVEVQLGRLILDAQGLLNNDR